MTSRISMFLERTFPAPLAVRTVLEAVAETGWCYETHSVDWRGSFLATDGRKMVCWFEAPDAESTRIALRQAGADIRNLWTGTAHEATGPVVPNVLVERQFAAPVTLDEIQAREDANAWCLESHRVQFARTFFAADRKRMLCFYRAPDAESVRLAQRDAGMPVQTVWAFDPIHPGMSAG